MADLALGPAKDIIKTGIAIKDAVETFHRNKKECKDLQLLVDQVMGIMSRIPETGLTSQPAMCAPALESLHSSLDEALKVVNKWQKRNGMHRLLRARGMAKQLRRLQEDIQLKLVTGNFAVMIEFTIEWKRTNTTNVQSQDGESSYTGVVKQKFVLKVSMKCEKSRAKARALVAKADGVSSMGFTGDAKDLIEVVGYSVDAVSLVYCLRKKIGHAELLPMEELKDKKPDESERSGARALHQWLVPCALMCALVLLASVWALR